MAESLASPWQSRNDVAQLRRFNWPREKPLTFASEKGRFLGTKGFSRQNARQNRSRKELGDPGRSARKFARANDFRGLAFVIAPIAPKNGDLRLRNLLRLARRVLS